MAKALTPEQIEECAIRFTRPGIAYTDRDIARVLCTLTREDALAVARLISAIRQVRDEDTHMRREFEQLKRAAGIDPNDGAGVDRLEQLGLVTRLDDGTVAYRAPGPRKIA